MIDENDVVNAAAAHLERQGFQIREKRLTTEHGIDLIADHPATGTKILVEAKGGTSSRRGSNRYGKPYTQSQVLDRVSKGFYTVAALHASRRDPDRERVALAIPETKDFIRYGNDVKPITKPLGIQILMVKDDGTVYEL
jgi:Holliday junction resolvase-like predicted endonuclease